MKSEKERKMEKEKNKKKETKEEKRERMRKKNTYVCKQTRVIPYICIRSNI